MPHNTFGYGYSPLLYNDWVILTPAGSDTGVVALDQSTGKEIWRFGSVGYCSNINDKNTYKKYRQLTEEDRMEIYAMKKAVKKQKKIANRLGLNPNTISRDLARNTVRRGYRPQQAHPMTLHRLFLCLVFVLAMMIGLDAAETKKTLAVGKLRCEYRSVPLGLDTERPRFSWVITSENRGVLQSTYQLVKLIFMKLLLFIQWLTPNL